MADLRLADAVDAAEPLLEPVRVPRQVVVDHQMRAALQVDALAGGIVGDHDAHHRIAVEGGDGGAARLAGDAAVDHDDGGGIADACHDLLLQIFERVPGLGEDDDLATKARGRIEHDRVVEDRLQLTPLGVLSRTASGGAPDLQGPSGGRSRLQLDRGSGRPSPRRELAPRRPRLRRPALRRVSSGS